MPKHTWTKSILMLLLCVAPHICQAKTAVLKRIRLSNHADKTRLVFDFNHQFTYKTMLLHHPERFVIDMPSVQFRAKVPSTALKKSKIKSIRHGKYKKKLRLVLDLKKKLHHSLFALHGKNPRLVLDFYNESPTHPHKPKAQLKTIRKPLKKSLKTTSKKKKLKKYVRVTIPKSVAPKPRKHREIVVVIDPGHGGKDPGASGRRGTKEKTISLAIARELKRLIDKEPGFRAVLTRRGDYYVGLRKRMVLAHRYQGDMFIAIHADAHRKRSAHGVGIYALSRRGATSEAARWLAQRENSSEFVGGLELDDKDPLLRSVLIDLSQAHTTGVSLQMGTDVLHQLSKFTTVHHNRVEQAAFVVLKSPDIPSILVETGFLSNPTEERNLLSHAYQHRIAYALLRGVKSYYMNHPPRDSMLAMVVNHHRS